MGTKFLLNPLTDDIQEKETEMGLEFDEFVRKPFKIEAALITVDNIHEVCKLIGHEVRENNKGPYIQMDKRIVPNSWRAFPGWYVTRMIGPKGQENLRAYPAKTFDMQFTPMSEDWAPWFDDEEKEAENAEEWVPDSPIEESTE
jgi:hypothetical protein